MTHSFPTRRSSDLGGIKVSVACRGVPSEKNAGEEGESDNTDPGWISARLTIRIKAIVVQDSRGCLNWTRRSKMNAHKDSLSDRWPALLRHRKLGRASGGERVCQYV